MAHYINPRSYAGFTSTDCRKEPFSEKDKSMVAKFDLAYHALIISGRNYFLCLKGTCYIYLFFILITVQQSSN